MRITLAIWAGLSLTGGSAMAQPATTATTTATTATTVDAGVAALVGALGRINSATSPTLSPDGRRLAYVSNSSGVPQIWVQEVGGNAPARQVTNLPDPVGFVIWSPAADELAYQLLPGGGLNTQIWVVKPDGTGARRLSQGGKENNGLDGWSRDGRYLLADSNLRNPSARDAALIAAGTGEWRFLTSGAGLNSITDVRGDRAVVSRLVGRGDDNLHLIDLKTGREVLLTPHEGKAETGWGALSADGGRVWVSSNIGRDRQAFGYIDIAPDGTPSPIRYVATREDAVAGQRAAERRRQNRRAGVERQWPQRSGLAGHRERQGDAGA